MNRRESIKTLSLTLGYTVAAPTLFQLLQSCEADSSLKWTPKFLNDNQAFVVEQLADLILPASKSIGALDVNVPQFIDLILKEISPKEEQKAFNSGASFFQDKFNNVFKKDILEGTKEDFLKLLSTYFKISTEKQERIFELMKRSPINVKDQDTYYLYKYLIFIRHYTLLGYYTSKEVGTEILNYNPVPGMYDGCVPLDEVGNTSSL